MSATTNQYYRIDIDAERRLIRLTLFGLWDRAILDQYRQDLSATPASATTPDPAGRNYRILIDLREHAIQPREVSDEIQKLLSRDGRRPQRHALLVSGSVLHKMQAQRIGSVMRARAFSDEAEALAWLFDETAGARLNLGNTG